MRAAPGGTDLVHQLVDAASRARRCARSRGCNVPFSTRGGTSSGSHSPTRWNGTAPCCWPRHRTTPARRVRLRSRGAVTVRTPPHQTSSTHSTKSLHLSDLRASSEFVAIHVIQQCGNSRIFRFGKMIFLAWSADFSQKRISA